MNGMVDNMTESCYENGFFSVTSNDDETSRLRFQQGCQNGTLEMWLAQLCHEVSFLQCRLCVAEAQISHLTTILRLSYAEASVCVNTLPPGLTHPTMCSFPRIAKRKVHNKKAHGKAANNIQLPNDE